MIIYDFLSVTHALIKFLEGVGLTDNVGNSKERLGLRNMNATYVATAVIVHG